VRRYFFGAPGVVGLAPGVDGGAARCGAGLDGFVAGLLPGDAGFVAGFVGLPGPVGLLGLLGLVTWSLLSEASGTCSARRIAESRAPGGAAEP
jgi:hypothetical protein